MKEVFSELFHQFCIPQRRRSALDEFLTDDEVDLVMEDQGANLPGVEYYISSKRIICVLADCRQWTHERALLELAFSLDMIGPGRFRTLRRAIGEPVDAATRELPKSVRSVERPRWERADGKLWFGDKAIRKLRICGTATRLERILDAFEKNSWKSSIAEPFGGRIRQGDLHRIVNQLNEGLKSISFHVRGGGREITWQVRPKRSVRVLK